MNDILSSDDLKMLRDGSGISDAVIIARGYRTVRTVAELQELGFERGQCKVPTLLMPVHPPDGSNSLYVHRPVSPRILRKKRRDGSLKMEALKYEIPKGASIRLDCPPICRPLLADPSVRLWITEGIKKGDALASRGLCAVALLGVWNFKGKNEFGATSFSADWDYIPLKGREVGIVFDSDVMIKPEVRKALERLTEHLQRKGAMVRAVYLSAAGDEKVGVDDFLLTHSVAELEALIDAPKPQPQPAPPVVELLDSSPIIMRKPLSLIEGRAFAAIWPYVQTTKCEGLDKEGNVIQYSEPLVTTEQRLFIVREDGRTYGEGGDDSVESLGIAVALSEIPPIDRLWSTTGLKAYRNGERANPADVLKRITQVVDRFIDFDHSLADQLTVCELVACYILATWFLPAFNVIGFIWPNGERGSGKTQLLTLVAELGYLGQLILAGSSFATLRDMADYGGTLCFDDAENLADPKKTDPDKRAFLLAGNRRGNTIALKEPLGNGKWQTRHVETFCARGFSAIRYPDPTLASRTITIPLVRTPDRYRANADPLDYNLWPTDRRKLIDDLWATSLSNLPKLPAYETDANARASLTGRNLEPFKAVLAVAAWLEAEGCEVLWKRIDDLSVAYQGERQEMESTDLTALVVRAICKCLVPRCDVFAFVNICEQFSDPVKVFLKTSEITEAAREIAEQHEIGVEVDYIKANRIGWIIKKLRLSNGREAGSGKKGWKVSPFEMQKYILAFGLDTPEKCSQNVTSSQKVTPEGTEAVSTSVLGAIAVDSGWGEL